MIKQHGGRTEKARVVDHFEATDLGAPFKVILHKSVCVRLDQQTKEILGYVIPDLEGLIRAVVISRVIHPRKLGPADIKFVRRSISVKQKEMAGRIELTPEHLSRCETGTLTMSPSSEKLLRIFALKTAVKLHRLKPCEAKTKLEDALDRLFDCIKPVSAHDVNEILELHFHRSRHDESSSCDGEDGQWDEEKIAA